MEGNRQTIQGCVPSAFPSLRHFVLACATVEDKGVFITMCSVYLLGSHQWTTAHSRVGCRAETHHAISVRFRMTGTYMDKIGKLVKKK